MSTFALRLNDWILFDPTTACLTANPGFSQWFWGFLCFHVKVNSLVSIHNVLSFRFVEVEKIIHIVAIIATLILKKIEINLHQPEKPLSFRQL